MENIPAYCARKQGEKWEAPHPMIHDILAETYGIMVYQEQVMQIAQVMGGYSLGGADLLRRAMGKKNKEEMAKQRAIFCAGAARNGVSEAKAGEVFDLMEKFAGYGFNKSHAAAYALLAYQTAWLKANHPVAFLAASMSLDLDKTEKLASHMQEAARLGIKVLPPDINRSEAEFAIEETPEGPAIRFALAAVKRVGLQAMKDLVAVRAAGGPFASLAEFAERVDPRLLNKMQLENLAKAGAFDSLEGNRARLVAGAETILRRAQASAEDRASRQIGLFSAVEQGPALLRLPEIPDWPVLERLAFEAEAVGFHLSAHPLDEYRGALRRLGVVPSARIMERARGGAGRLKLAGTVTGRKERNTRTGSRMAWISLSDQTGGYEVTLFSEVLNRARDLLEEGRALLVTCEARLEGEALRLTAQEVEALDKAAAGAVAGMRIHLDATTALPDIRALLERDGRGKGREPRPAPRSGAGGGGDAAGWLERLAAHDAGAEGPARRGGGGGDLTGPAMRPAGSALLCFLLRLAGFREQLRLGLHPVQHAQHQRAHHEGDVDAHPPGEFAIAQRGDVHELLQQVDGADRDDGDAHLQLQVARIEVGDPLDPRSPLRRLQPRHQAVVGGDGDHRHQRGHQRAVHQVEHAEQELLVAAGGERLLGEFPHLLPEAHGIGHQRDAQAEVEHHQHVAGGEDGPVE
jgi:hypothetical protein